MKNQRKATGAGKLFFVLRDATIIAKSNGSHTQQIDRCIQRAIKQHKEQQSKQS